MNYPSADRLEEKIGNKYSLVIVAAKRARQLKEGAMPLADVRSQNALSVALDEVASDKVVAIAPPDRGEQEDLLTTRHDASQAVALLATIGSEDLEGETDEEFMAEEEEIEAEEEAEEAEDEEEEAVEEAEAEATDEGEGDEEGEDEADADEEDEE